MMIHQTLNDVFPDWLTGGGIFSALQTLNVPWRGDNISSELDLIYHGDISGEKPISPLIAKVKDGDTLTNQEKMLLASAVLAICGTNWGKTWETMSLSYNPIENYSMTETMSDDETVIEYGKTSTRTDNFTRGTSGSNTETVNSEDTRTDDLDETTIPQLQTETVNNLYGFNSSLGVPSDDQMRTDSGNTVTERNGTQTLERDAETETVYNDTETNSGTQTYRDGGSDIHTHNYELTRSGNIGVTTSQQMIQSERDLWKWNYFYDVVFPDLNRVLTLRIY